MPRAGARLAGPGDVDTLATLLAEFRSWLGRSSPSADFFAERIATLMNSDHHAFLLDDDRGCGVLSFRASVWSTGGGVCCIEDLYVRAGARRRGTGAGLVLASIAEARERSCYRIELDVSRANATAMAFYERLGFESSDPDYGADNLVMRRTLDGRVT